MANLYSDDLSQVRLEDLENFLGLKLPENERPQEGPRLDFKESLPNDIGGDVAAMANSYGGLLFIGVECNKQKRNIPVSMPGTRASGGDLKARVTDMILSTVHPRPGFEIAVLPGGNTDHFVLSVRVLEGTYPPYEFTQGSTVRIPIRIQDTNRQATVREIESLIAKRGAIAQPVREFITSYRYPGAGDAALNQTFHERMVDNWQRIILAPRLPLRLRFDAFLENSLEQMVWTYFFKEGDFEWKFRRTGFFVIAKYNKKDEQLRTWEAWSSGALRFITSLRNEENIGDLALNMLIFSRMGRRFFSNHGYFGPVAFGCDMNCREVIFLPKFPPPGGRGSYDVVRGVQFPDLRPAFASPAAEFDDEVQWTDLENPSTVIATALLGHLRETWAANVHFDKLLEAIRFLGNDLKNPN